jgi:glycosyltransferase involved in cell wall biosynthesis
MRVAFVVPWFRTLGHLYGRELQRMGHEVLIATTSRHFEPGYDYCPELAAEPARPGQWLGSRDLALIRRAVRRFQPDIVLEDVIRDPRWIGLGRPVRRLVMVHDPQPHDPWHSVRGMRDLTSRTQMLRATGIVTFSESAHEVMAALTPKPVAVLPLVSEMPSEYVADRVRDRRGYLLIGRASRYKGFDVALEAWRGLPREVREANPLRAFISDGDPAVLAQLRREPHVDLRSGSFRFRDLTRHLASARAVLLPYRSVSQSGVQLLALQNGVVPLISDLPGLREFQPPMLPVVTGHDPHSWAQALIQLAHDDVAEQLGALGRSHYHRIAASTRLQAGLDGLLAVAGT